MKNIDIIISFIFKERGRKVVSTYCTPCCSALFVLFVTPWIASCQTLWATVYKPLLFWPLSTLRTLPSVSTEVLPNFYCLQVRSCEVVKLCSCAVVKLCRCAIEISNSESWIQFSEPFHVPAHASHWQIVLANFRTSTLISKLLKIKFN